MTACYHGGVVACFDWDVFAAVDTRPVYLRDGAQRLQRSIRLCTGSADVVVTPADVEASSAHAIMARPRNGQPLFGRDGSRLMVLVDVRDSTPTVSGSKQLKKGFWYRYGDSLALFIRSERQRRAGQRKIRAFGNRPSRLVTLAVPR